MGHNVVAKIESDDEQVGSSNPLPVTDSPVADNTQAILTEQQLLYRILRELMKMNIRLDLITNTEINNSDVEI